MIDYKKTKAPQTTITRDMNELTEKVGNMYETIAIIGKRSNQISTAMKKELDAKLQDFSVPQDSADETFENQEQIEISKNYEQLPKATLIATQQNITTRHALLILIVSATYLLSHINPFLFLNFSIIYCLSVCLLCVLVFFLLYIIPY